MKQITCGKVKGYTVGPNDVIPNGTPVAIGNRRGIVIGCETHNATPCGLINVHTVRLTHKSVYKFGNHYELEPLEKPQIWTGNYTALFVIKETEK